MDYEYVCVYIYISIYIERERRERRRKCVKKKRIYLGLRGKADEESHVLLKRSHGSKTKANQSSSGAQEYRGSELTDCRLAGTSKRKATLEIHI